MAASPSMESRIGWQVRGVTARTTPPPDLVRLLVAACVGDRAAVDRLVQADQSLCQATLTKKTKYSSGIVGEAATAAGLPTAVNWSQLLLGPNMDRFNNHGGMGALHVAAFAGHVAIVAFLLAAGASASAGLEDGATPLVLAAMRDHTDVAAALLSPSPDGQPVNVEGLGVGRALFTAAERHHEPMVRLLLDKATDADLRYSQCDRTTALHKAAQSGHVPTLRCLLATTPPSCLVAKDRDGNTPLDVAAAGNFTDAVLVLEAAAAAAAAAASVSVTQPEEILADKLFELMVRRVPPSPPCMDDLGSVLEEMNMRHPDSLLHAHRLVCLVGDAGLPDMAMGSPKHDHLMRMYQCACDHVSPQDYWLGRCVIKHAAERGFLTSGYRGTCDGALRNSSRIGEAAAGIHALRSSLDAMVMAADRNANREAAESIKDDAETMLASLFSVIPVAGGPLSAAVSIIGPLRRRLAKARAANAASSQCAAQAGAARCDVDDGELGKLLRALGTAEDAELTVAAALHYLVPVVRAFLSTVASTERSLLQRLAEASDVAVASEPMVAFCLNPADVRAARRVVCASGIDSLVAAVAYRGSRPALERGFAALDAVFAAHLREQPATGGEEVAAARDQLAA